MSEAMLEYNYFVNTTLAVLAVVLVIIVGIIIFHMKD